MFVIFVLLCGVSVAVVVIMRLHFFQMTVGIASAAVAPGIIHVTTGSFFFCLVFFCVTAISFVVDLSRMG
jgi:hypothetical protein